MRPEVHHGDAVAERPGEPDVVRDEDRAPGRAPACRPHEHLQHLRAHGDVERGDGLVADQRLGLERHRARDHDALALAAARARAGSGPSSARPARGPPPRSASHGALDLLVPRCRARGSRARSRTRLPTVWRGLSDWYGSWKTICTRRRSGRRVGLRERLAVEQDLAAGRRLQAEQRAAERRLAAAGLADDAEHLAAPPLQVDAVDARARRACRRAPGSAPRARGPRTAASRGGAHGEPARRRSLLAPGRPPRRGERRRLAPAATARTGSAPCLASYAADAPGAALAPGGSAARSGSAGGSAAGIGRHARGSAARARAGRRRPGRPRAAAACTGAAAGGTARSTGPLLGDLAGVHDRDALARLGQHREVVRDQDHAPARARGAAPRAAPGSAPASSRRAPWSARRR